VGKRGDEREKIEKGMRGERRGQQVRGGERVGGGGLPQHMKCQGWIINVFSWSKSILDTHGPDVHRQQ